MAFNGVVQESALGQLLYFVSGKKILAYPEDDPSFKIPWEEATAAEKEKVLEITGGNDTTSPIVTPAAATREDPITPRLTNRNSLTQVPTAHSSARREFGIVTTRTKTREQTLPWSAERFDVEREEAIERTQSSIIAPQKTADGITLVDWYTTDDPANPQNWNSWKKAFVGLVIWLYTFAVYCGSAIYTSSEPQIMEKFGVGQSKASLGLSMYVIGYGLGPMVSLTISET